MRYLFCICLFGISHFLSAQLLKGRVMAENDKGVKEPVIAATIYWNGTAIGATSDSSGYFQLAYPDSLPAKLIVQAVFFSTDTMLITSRDKSEKEIVLKRVRELKGVNVTATTAGTGNSLSSTINKENIGGKELLKAACCNLSESFTTNASVDVTFSDAVSGAKKIQMLGLDGVYTQMLGENVPILRGLGSTFGLSFIPGTWVESIQVTKGSGSVVNGYESISGQINIEFLKPQEVEEKVFVNVYGNHKGRSEANVHWKKKVNDKWGSLLFLHASDMGMKQDMNKDGFLDMAIARQYNVFNRWNYQSDKLEAQLGVKAVLEDRRGGQTNFNPTTDKGGKNYFGNGILTQQAEYFSKTGFLFPDKPYKSIGIITSGKWNKQEAYWGLRDYTGENVSFYLNSIYSSIINTTNHKFKTGASFLLDQYQEKFQDSAFSRKEIVPGVFTEYTYSYLEKFKAVLGLRGDNHNLYGFRVTPRMHLKYDIKTNTVVRISAGQGFRTANIFAENIAIFSSQRKINIQGPFLPEQARNYGINLTHEFTKGSAESTINVDFFRTDFQNQIIIDRETAGEVKVYNLKGQSYSHALQVDYSLLIDEQWDIKLAYKWYDVQMTYGGKLLSKPLLFRNRALLSLSYKSYYEKWKYDFSFNWFDKARMPSAAAAPTQVQWAAYSKPYFIINGQITRMFARTHIYLGMENWLNFQQPDPIISASDPFNNYFDASMIWAPLEGRIIYGGIRWKIR